MTTTRSVQTTSRRPLSAWELPKLLVPLHQHRRRQTKLRKAKERPHFTPILAFVYRNRYCLGNQIQRRFSDVLRSDRTTRRHLAEIQSLGYLDLVLSCGVGPNWPKVYHLTAKGASRLRGAMKERGAAGKVIRLDRTRREGVTGEHVIHELLTTQFLLDWWQTAEQRPDLELLQVERRSLARHRAFHCAGNGKRGTLEPDALLVHREDSRRLMCSLVEIDTGSMSIGRQIKAKFERYERWMTTPLGREFLCGIYRAHGARRPRPVFRLVLVTSGYRRATDASRLAQLCDVASQFPTIARRLWITTAGELCSKQRKECCLGGAIWRRFVDGGWQEVPMFGMPH